jgi:hypothetical protein
VNACDACLNVPGFGVLNVCRTNAQPAFAGWLELGGASLGGCPVACLVQDLHGRVRVNSALEAHICLLIVQHPPAALHALVSHVVSVKVDR